MNALRHHVRSSFGPRVGQVLDLLLQCQGMSEQKLDHPFIEAMGVPSERPHAIVLENYQPFDLYTAKYIQLRVDATAISLTISSTLAQ